MVTSQPPLPLADQPLLPVQVFDQAFEAWAASARRRGALTRASSVEAYRDLWLAFTRWCLSQSPVRRLETLDAEDLAEFLDTRVGQDAQGGGLTPRYAWRVLHLVDRVLAQPAMRSRGPANDAARRLLESRPEWRYANAAHNDALPEYLGPREARQVVDHLSMARPRPGRQAADGPWQDLRNRAGVALQLGAGLAPGEVRALKIGHVVSDGGRVAGLPWKLRVPGDAQVAMRETPVAVWAGQLLRHWLAVRREAGCGGDWLFPSTRSGKPWGKAAQYSAVKQVLRACGLAEDRVVGGSYRLRHTFALRQLRRSRPADEVARWLGVVDPAVMVRYQRVLLDPVMDLD